MTGFIGFPFGSALPSDLLASVGAGSSAFSIAIGTSVDDDAVLLFFFSFCGDPSGARLADDDSALLFFLG